MGVSPDSSRLFLLVHLSSGEIRRGRRARREQDRTPPILASLILILDTNIIKKCHSTC